MNKYEENVYKNIFEYPTKKIVELELENERLEKENERLEKENERLKKQNEILKENAEHNDKVVDKVNWELQQLKKQKDDVVELIKARIKENDGHINARMEMYYYQKMLGMLGEIDE